MLSASSQPRLRVGLLAAAADQALRQDVREQLRSAGAEVIDIGDAQAIDGVVVLLSAAAVADARWRQQVLELADAHLVPIRVAPVEADAVPDPLKLPNWIDWESGGAGGRALGLALAALMSDPERRRVTAQIEHQAQIWDDAHRDKALLLADHGHARRLAGALEELVGDPLFAPRPAAVAFVRASLDATKRRRRRRRIWRGIVAMLIITVVADVIGAVPALLDSRHLGAAAVVSTGETYILDLMPEWSALNTAAMLLDGGPREQQVARRTLVAALSRPWPVSVIPFLDNVAGMAPFDHGRLAAALVSDRRGSGLVMLDVRKGRALGWFSRDKRFADVVVTQDGRTAYLAGQGVEAIDLRARKIDTIRKTGSFGAVALARDGSLVLTTLRGGVRTVSVASKKIMFSATYRRVLGVATAGRATALVMTGKDRYALVDLRKGRVLTRVRVGDGQDVGAISSDGRRAVVPGPGDQLWMFGAGMRPRPLGIPVPSALAALTWASRDRLVVASDSARTHVLLLPIGEDLGQVCNAASRPNRLRVVGDLIVCVAHGLNGFWPVPKAPLDRSVPSLSAARSIELPGLAVTARGAELRVVWGSGRGSAVHALVPLRSRITALAVSPDRRQIVVGAASGQAAVVERYQGLPRVVASWKAPGAGMVSRAGWGAGPVVETSDGHVWEFTTCGRCGSDAELLAVVRARLTGCFTSRQLQNIYATLRTRLGLRVCQHTIDAVGS